MIGALAQLGERMTGSHEVSGSIPLCSTSNKPLRYSNIVKGIFLYIREERFKMNKQYNEMAIKISQQAIIARKSILTMTTISASGHPGGSMSSIDLLLSVYNVMHHDPQNPDMDDRDRLVVSIGHISPAVYSTLGILGYVNLEEAVSHFRQFGSIFEGHIERDVPGVEWSSGNLGQGLSAAVGFAIASKIKDVDYHVYVLMGDGEQQKGQLSEARRFASKYKLSNLTAIVDYNRLQISEIGRAHV